MAELARDLQHEHASVDRTLESITQAALDNVAGTEHAGVVIGRRTVDSRAARQSL